MITKLSFFTLRNERGLCGHIKRTAKRLMRLIPLIEKAEEIEKLEEQRVDAEKLSKSIMKFLMLLDKAYTSSATIQHDEEAIEFRLERRTRETERELERVMRAIQTQVRDTTEPLFREFPDRVSEYQKTEQKIEALFNRSRKEFKDLYRNRELMFRYITAYSDRYLTRIIRRLSLRETKESVSDREVEERIRRVCRDLLSLIVEYKRERNQQNKQKQLKKIKEKISELINLISEDAKRIGDLEKDIYQLLHCDIILGFHFIHNLESIRQTITRLSKGGFPQYDIRRFEELYNGIREKIQHSLLNIYRAQRYIKGRY